MQIAINGLTQERADSMLEQEQDSRSPKGGSKSFSNMLEKEQTKIEGKVKPQKKESPHIGKPESKEKKEAAKKALQKKLGQPDSELGGLFHFLYELVYKDPSEWSASDKEQFHSEKAQLGMRDLNKMLEERGMNLQDFSFDDLEKMTHMNTRRQFAVYLDKMMLGMEAETSSDRRLSSKDPFAGLKTSLSEMPRQYGVREEQIIKEIVKQISMRKIEHGTEMRIILNPKELGELNLGLILNDKGLSAQFKTGSSEVKEILEKHLEELAKALSEQGVRVKEIEVQKIS